MIYTRYLIKDLIKHTFSKNKLLPFKLTSILTYKCNHKCLICNIWKKPPSKELSLKEWDIFFSKNNWFSWVNLSGGEIFLREDIEEIFYIIKKRLPRLVFLDFPTNGFNASFITKKVIKICKMKFPQIFITVSIDGPPQVHNYLRGGNFFKEAILTYKMLKNLKFRNLKVYIGTTISDYNIDYMPSFLNSLKKYIPEIEFKDLHFNIYYPSQHYYNNIFSYTTKYRLKTLKFIKHLLKQRKNKSFFEYFESFYLRLLYKYLLYQKMPLSCIATQGTIFISPCGDVYPCSIYSCKLGNIKEYNFSLKAILNSEKTQRIRNLIKENKCPGCWSACEIFPALVLKGYKLL